MCKVIKLLEAIVNILDQIVKLKIQDNMTEDCT